MVISNAVTQASSFRLHACLCSHQDSQPSGVEWWNFWREAWLKSNGEKERQMKRKRRQFERHTGKRPHWFSVSMSRCRCTKRLEDLICDILRELPPPPPTPALRRSSQATAVHKFWSMAELCHQIVNLAESTAAAFPMINNKHAWPPIIMRDGRTEQPITTQTPWDPRKIVRFESAAPNPINSSHSNGMFPTVRAWL